MRKLLAGFLCLLVLPAMAEPTRHGPAGGRPPGGGARPPIGGHPSSPRPAFGGFGSHAGIPRPNHWSGNLHNYNYNYWRGGRWYHGLHNGALAWWWIVGPDWYYFDRPAYPYPDFDIPPGTADGWWYWCAPVGEYYPYVTYCPVPWVRIRR